MPTTEQTSSDNVSNQRRDDTFPDVQFNRNLRRSNPNGHRNQSHVGDNVIEAQRDEPENRPPDTHQLRGKVATLQAEETAHTDEPVAANATQEHNAEVGRDLFLVGEGDDFGFVRVGREHLSICSR